MIRGGGFAALQDWLLRVVARTVRGAELAMVAATGLINACITINTAAEIAIAPYIRNIGRRFNLSAYRRANILDANTSALGYIFPWSGGVLVGYTQLSGLDDKYDWFSSAFVVNPADVWLWVFHGWFLVIVFILAALTGFGREYTTDKPTGWRLRSARPGFEPGQVLDVDITSFDAETSMAIVHIGDTVLEVPGLGPGYVDTPATIRVSSFDTQRHRGQAEHVRDAVA